MNNMNIQNKNKLLVITVLILLIANIGTFSTILIHKNKLDKRSEKRNEFQKRNKNKKNMFLTELNLNNEQKAFFKQERKQHFIKSNQIREQINQQKQAINNEIFKTDPDIKHISLLSDSIGKLNAEFEKENYHHFLRLKQTLEPDQTERFKQIVNKASFNDPKKHRSRKKGK